jgi:hypothetical protein
MQTYREQKQVIEEIMSETMEGIIFANNRCPCKIWLDCPIYNKRIWKQNHDDEHIIMIHKWYDTMYRTTYQYPDITANG